MNKKLIAGNTSTGWLKVLALCFMFIDHAGILLGIADMRTIGRLAFPLYCWCLVVGVSYTRSVPKYMLRLLLVGLASQPLYMLALNHTWSKPNIFLTLLLALGGLWGLKEKKWFSHIWAPAATLLLAEVLNADYGFEGVLLVFLLYAVRDSRPGIAAVMIAFCLFWGRSSQVVTQFYQLNLSPLLSGAVGTILQPFLRKQALALLSLPLMLIRMPHFRMPAWLGYALYPAHLAVLYLMKVIM